MTAGAHTDVAPDAAWAGYLDALEAAVRVMDGQVLDGQAPAAEALEALGRLSVPAAPLPPRLRDRRDLLLAMLDDVTERATAHRDEIAAQLAALPHRRARGPAAPATLGATLDVVG